MLDYRKHPSLVVNAGSNYVALVVNILVGLALTPYIIHELGKSGYGLWSLVGSVAGYLGLLSLGVSNAVVRQVAYYLSRRDIEAVRATVSTALAIFVVVAIVVALASYVVSAPLASFFSVSAEWANDFRTAFWLLGAAIGVTLVASIFEGVLCAKEQYPLFNSINVGILLTRATLTAAFLEAGWGLPGVAWASLIAGCLSVCGNYIVECLSTHLVVSPLSGAVVVFVLIMLLSVACFFSWWVFRRTARETVAER